ncbi:MAG: SDR family NAD(P)-dependent oxidoreductase [Christensenellales bacterium]|jgi:NAD(P)-dependent dehydrogenase (short-subunit alcohol dehydrogenase family)
MKYPDLADKTVMIVGAAQGIGRGTAEVFAQNDVKLFLCDKNVEKMQQTAKEIMANSKASVFVHEVDITDAASIQAAVDAGAAEYGSIDVLVNCAGLCIASKVIDLEEELWDLHMNVNLKGHYLLSKAVARHMIEKGVKGKILTISSQASKAAEYGNVSYCCSKAAINMFTQVLALELAEHGITVNCVCPGYVNTDIMQRVFIERGPLEGMTPEEYEKKLCSAVPLNRMAEPREIGEFLAFLASAQADYITGSALGITGGNTLI